jgi:hypothetical protein
MAGVERLHALPEYPGVARDPYKTTRPGVQGITSVWCRVADPPIWEPLGQGMEYFGYPERDSQLIRGKYYRGSATDTPEYNGLYFPVMFARQVREGTLHLQRYVAAAHVYASDRYVRSVFTYATLSPLIRRRNTNHTYHNIFLYAHVHFYMPEALVKSYTNMLEIATRRGVSNENFLRDFYLQRLTLEVTLTNEDRTNPVKVTFKSKNKNVISPTHI